MKLQFFTIPAMMPAQAQEAFNRFCGAHQVISIEKQFVADGENSYWALCVCYREATQAVAATLPQRKNKIDYRAVLSEHDFALYARLRELRRVLAEQEGLPAYALFTNEQLAAMIQQRMTSKAALENIPGVGAGRIEKYGSAFLQLLQQAKPDDAAPQAPAS